MLGSTAGHAMGDILQGLVMRESSSWETLQGIFLGASGLASGQGLGNRYSFQEHLLGSGHGKKPRHGGQWPDLVMDDSAQEFSSWVTVQGLDMKDRAQSLVVRGSGHGLVTRKMFMPSPC